MKLSSSDKTLHIIIYILLIILGMVTLYPFWNSAVISFNVGMDTSRGGVTIWPRQFTLDNYKIVFQDNRILHAFYISVMRTLAGTAISIFLTAIFAYGLSVKGVIGKKYYMIFAIITMYFSGGLIPFYLVNRELGLMNSFWVMVIPTAVSVWNMIIFRTFFMGLPVGLEESAKIDGCSTFGIFFRIVLPLSGPVLATLSLFTAVYHWNDWFTATIFINKTELFPIQTMLQQILNSNIMSEQLTIALKGNGAAADAMSRMQSVTTKSLTMATMMVATLPIIAVYPFVQRFFVKGVLVGSLKE
ncbi:putative aldouronate transport system permease protein [Paenibacillus castaneae]|uniref:carbohydrate ABC transporter permease n=1 Tax=Paenibacillus castaneae TaxID=474957 RepID=UPI000C9CF54B|nr:carbohydrate ABC transporter permease [Paenibacillus castaneae]NIK77853.1 putative aldouronate transport system permease protein [Paenibacillus castaneae]